MNRLQKQRERLAFKMLGHVKAPKDKTVEAARVALVSERQFAALSVDKQMRVLEVFNDEWSKVGGDTIRGVDVIEVPKRIHNRLVAEKLMS